MTFKLKDLKTLRDEFNETLQILYGRHKKKHSSKKEIKDYKIEDLGSPRREEAQFLSSVLTVLEDRSVSAKKESNNPRFAAAYYGAMQIILKDIEQNVSLFKGESKENSMLYRRLQMAFTQADEKQEVKPDARQTATFYKEINEFLLLVFNEYNSRLGLKDVHRLNQIPTENLARYLTIGYMQEEEARNKEVRDLSKHAPSKVEPSKYRPAHEVNKEIVAKFEGWAKLTESFKALIASDFAHKNAAKLKDLSADRNIQLSFLTNIKDSLHESKGIKEDEKVAILAGAMYLVRGQIAVAPGYGKAPLDPEVISQSKIHTDLTALLKPEDESPENIEALLAAAYQYIYFMTIEPAPKPSTSSKTLAKKEVVIKDSIRQTHLFSDIKGFDLVASFCLLHNMIATCRAEAVKVCTDPVIAAEKSKMKAKAPKSSGFFGWGKGTAKDEVDEETNEADVVAVEANETTAPAAAL